MAMIVPPRLDELDGERAVAQVSVPAAALAVERLVAKAHQVEHDDGCVVWQRRQRPDVQMIDAMDLDGHRQQPSRSANWPKSSTTMSCDESGVGSGGPTAPHSSGRHTKAER
jgi:hypothetical protein